MVLMTWEASEDKPDDAIFKASDVSWRAQRVQPHLHSNNDNDICHSF